VRFVGLRYEPEGVSESRDKRPVSFNPPGGVDMGGFILWDCRIRVFVYLIGCWGEQAG
jgi:hypothetical protein